MSFFHSAQETGVLFLPRKFHFAMAVLLVEVYGSCIPDGAGGLKSLEYENAGILSQVNWLLYSVFLMKLPLYALMLCNTSLVFILTFETLPFANIVTGNVELWWFAIEGWILFFMNGSFCIMLMPSDKLCILQDNSVNGE